ncbi:lipase family protein [Halioxenophilus aromaticivorans]
MKLQILILITGTLTLNSCGVVKTIWADHQYENNRNDKEDPDYQHDMYLKDMADKFGIMALFANTAYRDDLKGEEKEFYDNGYIKSVKSTKKSLKGACDYRKSDSEPTNYGMPHTRTSKEKWYRWKGNPNIKSRPCYNKQGLYYETYVYGTETKIQTAVIAFRGTENSWNQIWYDWTSNFASAMGFQPKQYKIAARHIPVLISALVQTNPDIDIYTTGHSLGGGLAQQAGYLSKNIKEVITFDTSPVTNWSSLALEGKVKNAYPVIHRIYNGGEALASVRSISTLFTRARYNRHDLGIQINKKHWKKGHSMELITCHLACLIADDDKAAQHNLSPDYIKTYMFNDGGICQGYSKVGQCKLNSGKHNF